MARDIEEELAQLRQLRDIGALSDDEYRQAKAVLKGNSAPDRGTGAEDIEARPKRSRARTGEATGKTRPSAKGLYRHSGKLVIREGAKFPGRCAICNKESDGEPLDFAFGREKSHYIEVAVAQTLAHAAADLMKGAWYTGPVRAAIPLCSWHRKRRLMWLGFGIGLAVLASGYIVINYPIWGPGEFGIFQISIYSIIAIVAALAGIAIALAALLDSAKLWFKPAKFYAASSG